MSGDPAVFVDRDGTLIREVGYLRRLDQLELLPQVAEAIQLLRRHGLKVVVITNQSAVARGLLGEDALQAIHHELERRLAGCGAFLDGIYYCPHHPTEGVGSYRIRCDCRKPNVGLVSRAAMELGLDITRSYAVGDQMGDMEMAARLGAKGILLKDGGKDPGGQCSATADVHGVPIRFEAPSFWAAAQWIVHDLGGGFPGKDGA